MEDKIVTKIDFLETRAELPNVFLCDQSKNITGTIKDQRNERIISESLRLGVDKLTLITSGNNGYSLAKIAENTPVKVVSLVPRNIDNALYEKLSEVSYNVFKINLDEKILRPEEIIAFAREKDDEVIWDVTNGYEEYYTPLVKKITTEIPDLDYIVVPLGSGGIFVGFSHAVNHYSPNTKIIAIGPQSQTSSIADKLCTPWTPYNKAISICVDQGHFIYRLTENDIKMTFNKYSSTCLCEPSSSIVFAAPKVHNFKHDDKIVFLNTGKLKTS